MNTGTLREQATLVAALSQITEGFCPYCTHCRVLVRWNSTRGRWQIMMRQPTRCSTNRYLVHRRFAAEFLVSLLELHGVFVADYGDSDLVVHGRVQFI